PLTAQYVSAILVVLSSESTPSCPGYAQRRQLMKYPEIQFEPFFSWVNRPRIMYSPGVRRELGYEMSQLGGSKVVIFTDEGLINAGVAEMVAKEVRDSDLQLAGIFDKILQDARIN